MASLKFFNDAQTFWNRFVMPNPTMNTTITVPERTFTVAGTDNVATAKAEAIAAVNPILAEYTVTGSAVTSIDFSGLDINAHGGSYEIEMRIIGTGVTGNHIALYINGDTVSTNYTTVYLSVTATVAGSRSNASQIIYVASNTTSSSISTLILSNSRAKIMTKSGRYDDGSAELYDTYINKTATVTNITQLTFTALTAGLIGIGSKIIIRRKDK